jgi:Lrp/AsnC family transcriptional regulator for asnA, asnC and gidA
MAYLGLDKTDLLIIRHLQEDGRRSLAAIGRDVGLSEPGVRKRVRRLLSRKVIRVVAVSDPLELGFMTAEVLVRVRGRSVFDVADDLRALAEVDYLAFCAGAADLIVGLVCRDREHLMRTLAEAVKGRPGVESADVYVLLRVAKEAYDWWGNAEYDGRLPKKVQKIPKE